MLSNVCTYRKTNYFLKSFDSFYVNSNFMSDFCVFNLIPYNWFIIQLNINDGFMFSNKTKSS